MKQIALGMLGGVLLLVLVAALPQDVYNTKYTQHIATLLKLNDDAKLQMRSSAVQMYASAAGVLDVTAGSVVVDATVADSAGFTTTATADTVVIPGALASDYYILTGVGGSVDQQDVLQAEAKTDTLIVHRLAAGASGLNYYWLRLRN